MIKKVKVRKSQMKVAVKEKMWTISKVNSETWNEQETLQAEAGKAERKSSWLGLDQCTARLQHCVGYWDNFQINVKQRDQYNEATESHQICLLGLFKTS